MLRGKIMNKEKIIITGKMIEIKGTLARHKIVQKVVNTFISTEYRKKGKGVSFQYPVEKLSDGILYIIRPGYKTEASFDFKVEIPQNISLGKEKQKYIALDLRTKVYYNPQQKDMLIQAISCIYNCEQNNIDLVLKQYNNLVESFSGGIKIDDILKVIKWFFIMEDTVYWNYEGRAFLYNFINYIINETNEERLNDAVDKKMKRPDELRSYMKKAGLEWKPCKT